MVDPRNYLVLDVETNGLKAERDDLLSISIYKPDDGRRYNRFLPLEKQSKLNPEATAVNGIRRKDLRGKKPLSQEEVDSLLEEFDARNRTILAFGGSHGSKGRGFDERFLEQYFADHGLRGLDELSFFDFKRMVHSSGYGLYPASKDNLCRAFGIEGVSDTHTSMNDCILEWELFEAMDGQDLIVTDGNVFKLNHDYVMPASYLDHYSGLCEYAGVPRRYVNSQEVFALELSEETTKEFKRFPTNISGMTFEPLIDAEMQAREVDSRERLLKNKSKLEYVGSFEGAAEPILVEKRDDGITQLSSSVIEKAAQSVRDLMGQDAPLADALDHMREKGGSLLGYLQTNREALDQFRYILSVRSFCTAEMAEQDAYLKKSYSIEMLGKELEKIDHQSAVIEATAKANEAIRPELGPLTGYLKKLLGPEILAQELVVNQDDGCLALCDLSSKRAVVEIKTGVQGYNLSSCANQLYYQANGRECYVVHVRWGESTPGGLTRTKLIVDKIGFTTEKPKVPRRKSEKRRRRYAIRHAITEWRYSNAEGTPEECARSLWLVPAEVREVWTKANPDIMFESVPRRGKSRLIFDKMVSWRESHPKGTRLELFDEEGLQMLDIERWWYQAAMPTHGGKGSMFPPKMDAESIRTMLGDIADESNLYASWTDREVDELREHVRQLCRQVGISTEDLRYTTLFWARESLKEEEKIELVSGLKSLERTCQEEVESDTKVLRIPLHKTRYKTRRTYLELNSVSTSIHHEMVRGKEGKNIVITISEKRRAVLKPQDELYETAEKMVEELRRKYIQRVYIERLGEKEGELVVAISNKEPAWVSALRYRSSI